MPVDVKKFVTDLDDVSADDRAHLERIFGGSKKAQEAVMRQDEFDRQMNAGKQKLKDDEAALATKRSELAAQEAELNAEVTTLATWKTTSERTLADARAAVTAAEQKVATTRSALDRAVTDAGLDRDTYLKDVPDVKPNLDDKKPKEPVVDDKDSKFIDRTQLERGVIGAARLSAQLADLQQEHLKVFGVPLPAAEALLDETLERARKGEQGVSIRTVWAEKHKVSDAIEAQSKAAQDQRVKDAVEAERIRVTSEMAISGGRERSEQAASPVLQMAAKKDGVHQAGVRPGVEAAVKDFETRKAAKPA